MYEPRKYLPQKPNKQRTVGNSVSVILGQFFRHILADNQVKPENLDFFMTRYIQDPVNNYPQDRRSLASARGNLRKELLNKYMSWRVFCKGLAFIRVKKFTLTITATYSDGKTKQHSVAVDLSIPEEEAKHYEEMKL